MCRFTLVTRGLTLRSNKYLVKDGVTYFEFDADKTIALPEGNKYIIYFQEVPIVQQTFMRTHYLLYGDVLCMPILQLSMGN